MNATAPPPDGPPPLPVPHPAGAASINRRRWWIHLFLVGAYVLLVGMMGRAHSEARKHFPALSHTVRGLLSVCTAELLFFALVLGLALVASRASRDDLLLHWRRGFWPVPLGIGYSIALRLAISLLVMAAGIALIVTHVMTAQSLQEFVAAHRPDVETLVDISAMRENPLYFWLVLIVVSFVVAGLREELWRSAFLAGLRALWPQRFGSRAGQIGAVAIASVIFGFGHLGMGAIAVLFTGLLGFGLGLIMVYHRSIWPAVIAHGMFDATSLALLPWVAEKLPELQRTLGH
ncbi:MAG: CPBP family intramembrane glutamic endopeptidase [Limisphaerales bacterium]